VISSEGKVSLFKEGNLIKELSPIKANLFQLNFFDKKGTINRHKLIEIDTIGKPILRFDSKKQQIKINDQHIQITFDLEERIIDSVFTSKRNGSKIILEKRYNPSGLFEENQTVSRSGKTISFDGILYNFPEKGIDEIQVNDSIYLIESDNRDKGSILYNKKRIKQETPVDFKNVFESRSKETVYIVRNSFNYGILDANGKYLVELQTKLIAPLNDSTLLVQNSNYKIESYKLSLKGRKYGGMLVSIKSDCLSKIIFVGFDINSNFFFN
jgi:hypothetical protein